MVLTSDVKIDLSRVSDSNITPQQHALNAELTKLTQSGARWYEIGAPKYREMRANGQTSLPGRTVLPEGTNINIPSRDGESRSIPCRIFVPPSSSSSSEGGSDDDKPVGVFMHVHGGGWVLQSELDFDPMLKFLAESARVVVVSVGYRLAPEHPFPAGPNDVYDVADYLAEHAEERFGAPLRFISGESAGGHLSALACIHLLSLPQPYLGIKGLILHFGAYDLSGLPAWKNFGQEIILPRDVMNKYIDVFVPQHQMDPGFLKKPEVSPFYADLKVFGDKLPPALFAVGTVDPLFDDTIFMGTKWMLTGTETVIKIYPGQPHGFVNFAWDKCPAAKECLDHVVEFIQLKLK